MTKFASGKNAFAISDRSGFRYRYKDMRKEWNGLLVGRDPQALQDARPQFPDTNTPFMVKTTNGITYLGNGNWATSGTAELPTEINNTVALEGSVGEVTVTT